MKKKLTLWILFAPVVLFSQTGVTKDGVITLDFGKKKIQSDTIPTQKADRKGEDDYLKPKKTKKTQTIPGSEEEEAPDFKRDGLFKGLFHAGINGAQVDGDLYYGFKYPGFDGGVGAMVRFHKLLSVSMELNYSMKGARQTFFPNASDSSRQRFQIQWDYIEMPISLNIHDKKLIMFSLGAAPAVMVRYKERNEQGDDNTENPPGGQPRRFDLPVFAMLNFIIKKHFAIGLKYSYTTIPIRPAVNFPATRVRNQYNQVLTIRFTYIMDAVKKKR